MRRKLMSVVNRFIPVCTGNTGKRIIMDHKTTVHPRVYGEHSRGFSLGFSLGGSSPCVRGTRKSLSSIGLHARFIPVCTGNTCTLSSVLDSISVHPRVYGEHQNLLIQHYYINGSSPCVRGTPTGPRLGKETHRFIPVCTGNTGLLGELKNIQPVHPRVYGEHECAEVIVTAAYGSSPCVRGTRACRASLKSLGRFIPVCTGNTAHLSPPLGF